MKMEWKIDDEQGLLIKKHFVKIVTAKENFIFRSYNMTYDEDKRLLHLDDLIECRNFISPTFNLNNAIAWEIMTDWHIAHKSEEAEVLPEIKKDQAQWEHYQEVEKRLDILTDEMLKETAERIRKKAEKQKAEAEETQKKIDAFFKTGK